MNRRESLKLMAVASLAAAIPGCTVGKVDEAALKAEQAAADGGLAGYKPTQLSAREFATLGLLVDYIIPADDRSGSATDAAVPLFIDFMMGDAPELQEPVHSGLAWIDEKSRQVSGVQFAESTSEQHFVLLDQIAFPETASPEVSEGVAFFSTLRDLTASGFWSSKMGMTDLNYTGNTPQASWDGCSHDAMAHLGISYDS